MWVGSAGDAEDNEGNSKGSQDQRKTRDRPGSEAAIIVMMKKQRSSLSTYYTPGFKCFTCINSDIC